MSPEHAAGVRSMMAALAHRGPDAEGFFHDASVALGHRRLSIIDLRPEAHQPVSNEDGTITLVANGEVYNYVELREELRAKGHRFRSSSDSEVIVHLYEEEGVDCVARLRGMFAFAIWDAGRRRLFLARDRVGKKPLFYAARGGSFWFASEVAALVSALPWRPPVDYDALDQYLTLQYVPAPLTAYETVRKLPAAHRLVIEPGGEPRVERYWRLSFEEGPEMSLADTAARARELIEESVSLRRVADVPVGAFLSGGVDSSTVVALMARQSARPVQTFSVDFPPGDGGEARYARMVADRYRTEHHELVITPDMVSILPRLVQLYGEPFADPSAVPTYYVAELARRHVVVALSGDGGDEAFAGYGRYGLEQVARTLDRLPPGASRAVYALMRRLPGAAMRPFREFAADADRSTVERYLFFLAHFTAREKRRTVGPALLELAGRGAVAREFERILSESDAADAVNRMLDLDTQTYLPDDIFTKVDIASMSHALEVRAPLSDHVLLEWLARRPGRDKLQRFRGKRILRAAVRDLVPSPILSRRKKGFGLPLGRWMRHELAVMSRDLLTDRTARQRGVVRPEEAERLLEEHRAGIDHGERLWNLTVLELWFRAFVDAPPERASDPRAAAQ